MKILNIIGIVTLTVFFLTNELTYAQVSTRIGINGEKGQYDESLLSDYNAAIKINPKDAEAYINRGVIYGSKGQHDKAINDFNMVIKLNPKYALAYFNRGKTYDEKGQYDKAISDYNMVIKINPNDAEAYTNRGIVYGNKSQYGKAISDFNVAIKINPKDVLAYTNRGVVYIVNLGNMGKGCADFKKACEYGTCENYNIGKQMGDCP